MNTRRIPYRLQLFTLRLWLEVLDKEQVEWRGELKNTSTGEARYFRDGATLLSLLAAMLAEPDQGSGMDAE
jgi:hypothetical protein